jgi:hypothetical protein
MKYLLLSLVLSLTGCGLRDNQARVVYAANGGKSVDVTCGSQVNECYRLLQNTCNSNYRVLFVNYTGMVEYTISANCDRL